MPGLNDALERLVNDAAFRGRLAANPAEALAGYDLSQDELELLASGVTESAGVSGAVEARTSKASLVGFMSALGDVAEALSPTASGLDAASLESAGSNPVPTESISFNFSRMEVSYPAEGETLADDIAADAPHGQVSDEEVSLTYRRIEIENVQSGDGDPTAAGDLAAPGVDPNARDDGDVDGRDFLAWQRSAAPPAGGSDALAWDVGDGSDAAAGPNALATPESGGVEPTGPIADVLYSAGGNSAPETPAVDPGTAGSAGFVPVVGDWNGDAATADGDSDGRDFLAWQRQYGQDDPGLEASALSADVEGNEQIDLTDSLVVSFQHAPPNEVPLDALPAEPSLDTVAGSASPPEAGDSTAGAGVLRSQDSGQTWVAGEDAEKAAEADSEPLAVKLENVQITSYQLGVLDNDAATEPRNVELLPDGPGSETETQ